MVDPAELQFEINECAAEFDVCPDIHREDFIFQFLASHPVFNSKRAFVQYYFSDGNKSARRLADLVERYFPARKNTSLLEFASGYGCVSRHLRKSQRWHDLLACDIHQAAVDFSIERLGVSASL